QTGAQLRRTCGEMISAFYMPSRHSSDATAQAARTLAEDVGARFSVRPLDDAFTRELEATAQMLEDREEVTELTRQNIQARLRGQRMWNWANSSGALFLQTGNMSEKSVGYTTVGGDLEGCFSVIANLPKTVVSAMLERLQRRHGWPGIAATLATTAGPELAADQSGEDELMPFAVLDACLYLYAGERMSAAEVASALVALFPDLPQPQLTGWANKVARLFTRSIFKWVQAPLVVHVGTLDLERERALQLPVVQQTEWERRSD
ncbi:MAG: NAD(+) synthase, partial [Myxococcota bacterium]